MKYKNTKKLAFPLGGIGTGCISLAGNGELNDWEIFNRPNKDTRNGYSHFAIKATGKNGSVTKVLQGDTNEDLTGIRHPDMPGGFDFGPRVNTMAGFPHFRSVEFDGAFPMAKLLFCDEDFPANVRLYAFNPFIPHDAFNSSLPAAFFIWEIENTTDSDMEYSVAFSVQNPAGCSQNIKLENGYLLTHGSKSSNELGYCDLTVMTDADDVAVQANWYRGKWQDGVTTYWKDLSQHARMPQRSYPTPAQSDHAAVVAYATVKAGERKRFRFVLAWNAPLQYNYWSPQLDENGNHITWKNYYATQFKDSKETAQYALSKFDELFEKTQRFTEALHNSSLPDFVIDAVSANLSVLKSPTVLRLEDGSLWGWEGVHDRSGLCEGSCQHVWNYAYALPFLFPELERSLREITMEYGMDHRGSTTFRVPLPLGKKPSKYFACVDGQMGEVIKCYREWKISGDTAWLRKHKDAIFAMLEFAWSKENPHEWDLNHDGVMDGRQHNTLDIELFSANSWLQGFYLLALDCGAKMADALGETARAEEYRQLYASGKAWTNEHLFNGEYFCQIPNLTDKARIEHFAKRGDNPELIEEAWQAPHLVDYYWNDEAGQIKYQIGEGCIIDQMLADWHGAIIGADDVFEKEKKHTALRSLYKYNFKSSMRNVVNPFRNFAINDEAGTIICSYPEHKVTPAIPILYEGETMTGFEYALAGLMLSQGFIAEGESIVKAVRDRYDGLKRNPWSEIECGHHYARTMASYSLLLIYSGFSFDMPDQHIGFKPINKGDGAYFWSVKSSYGTMSFNGKKHTLSVIGEKITLSSFGLRDNSKVLTLRIDGKDIAFSQKDDVLIFNESAIGTSLEIEIA